MSTADTTAPPTIAARAADLVKTYGTGDAEVRALDGVSLDIDGGRFTSIMGPSGSGKSTLLHCMAGLDSLTSGTVTIGDAELSSLSDRNLTKLRRTDLGFVFQSFNLIPTLTARENMTLPIDLGGGTVDSDWFDQVVDAVGLKDRLGHRPSELSGGQQQRVAVARALMTKPKIVFADEPTGNLDSHAGNEILTFISEAVQNMGQTVVMVTHDPYAAAYGNRVVFLADGHIVGDMDQPTADGIIDQMKQIGQQ